MFSSQQTGGRLPEKGKYHPYPFKEVLNFANVSVFKLNKDERFLSKFEKKKS